MEKIWKSFIYWLDKDPAHMIIFLYAFGGTLGLIGLAVLSQFI